MKKKKEEWERKGERRAGSAKKKRRQKHLRHGEKFPLYPGKGESNAGDTEFSSNVFVANDNPLRRAHDRCREQYGSACVRVVGFDFGVIMPTVRYNARQRTCQPSIRRYFVLHIERERPCSLFAKLICNVTCKTRTTRDTLSRCISVAHPSPPMKFSAPLFSPILLAFLFSRRFPCFRVFLLPVDEQ